MINRDDIELLGLSYPYRYALFSLYDKGLLKTEADLYGCAFVCYNEEQGSLASPISEELFSQFYKALPCPPQGKLSLEDFLNTPLLVSTEEGDIRPFVQKEGLIYSRRSYQFEEKLLKTLQQTLLPRIQFSNCNSADENLEKAVKILLNSGLLILTGGPGFGKTTALAILLEALLFNQEDRENYKIALAAPTGRAAARMQVSLKANQKFPLLQQFMPTKALTLHRLLGYNPNTGQCRFNHHNPLPYNVLAVDESSMVDVFLFGHLLQALKPETALILIGDANQLPSVGMGSIFSDLITNYKQSQHLLHQHIIELTTCYRSTPDIFNLAKSALQGQVKEFYDQIKHSPVIKEVPLETPQALAQWLKEHFNLKKLPKVEDFKNSYSQFTTQDKENIIRCIDFYKRFILLTPLREGSPYSAGGLNPLLNALQAPHSPYHGQPLMITSNNPELGLANGDRGVIISLPSSSSAREFFVFFEEIEEPISLAQLAPSDWETAYVTTIHKSQGSEFEAVALVIPPLSGRVLSQKLLYTAITRAKEQLYLIKDDNEMKTALLTPSKRYSGIPAFLLKNEKY